MLHIMDAFVMDSSLVSYDQWVIFFYKVTSEK